MKIKYSYSQEERFLSYRARLFRINQHSFFNLIITQILNFIDAVCIIFYAFIFRLGTFKNIFLLGLSFLMFEIILLSFFKSINLRKSFFTNDKYPNALFFIFEIKENNIFYQSEIGKSIYKKELIRSFFETKYFFIFCFIIGTYITLPKKNLSEKEKKEIYTFGHSI